MHGSSIPNAPLQRHTVQQDSDNAQRFVPHIEAASRVVDLDQCLDSAIIVKGSCRMLYSSHHEQSHTVLHQRADKLQKHDSLIHRCGFRRFQVVHNDIKANRVDDRLTRVHIYG